MSDTLVIASHNPGKLKEISKLLTNLDISVKLAADFDIPEPEETENTFEGNAILKAKFSYNHTKLPCLADDTGLVVPALNGAPGIYSARWAGPEKDFKKAMQRVHDELDDKPSTAYFICCLALIINEKECYTFTGRTFGTLTWPARGTNNMGYDSMFIPLGETRTYAEMTPEEKIARSHRTIAFNKLLKALPNFFPVKSVPTNEPWGLDL